MISTIKKKQKHHDDAIVSHHAIDYHGLCFVCDVETSQDAVQA